MTDNDLQEFERSLRQLEYIADAASPNKRQSNTRNTESRTQKLDDDLSPSILIVPEATMQLATEQNQANSDKKFYKTQGASTRKPSNSDILGTDSVLNSGGGIYEQMKRNMEKTVEREQERIQRKKTLKQINMRDAEAKQQQQQQKRRRTNSELVKGKNKSQQNITDVSKSPQQSPKKLATKDLFSPARRQKQEGQSHHKRGSSPRFRSPSSDDNIRDYSPSGRPQHQKSPRPSGYFNRSATARTQDSQIEPAPPSMAQIKEQHRMNALKVVDLYKQLQNSPLLAIQDLKENQMVSAEIDLSNMNNMTPRSGQPDESQRDLLQFQPMSSPSKLVANKPLVTNAARNPTNDDIITSTFVHVLSAFAIAEAQQDIFLRIKQYVILGGFELPKLNGIYNGLDFDEVRAAKTSYLHFLFSQALQTAVHANWISMAHSILIHCKEMRFNIHVSKMDLSVLLHNSNYELMNLLIEYAAYFDRNERSIEAERMNLLEIKQPALNDGEAAATEQEFETISNQNLWLNNQTGWKKNDYPASISARSSQKQGGLGSPFKNNNNDKLAISHDNYSKALTNLDQTMVSMRSQTVAHEQTMMENLKRGLVAGHSQLNASHFVRQLYDDRQSLGPVAQIHERFQKQIRALLKALCQSQNFEQVIPLLVLRGNRDLVYEALTDKKNSKFNFELSFDIQKSLALEFFCFSVSQEQSDEAINVLLKFQGHLTITYRKKCLNEILLSMKRSAAFIELKYFLLSQYYSRLTQSEAIEVLDIIENRLIATFMHQSQHRVVLLQNVNSLRTGLLTLFMMAKISKLIPHSENRVGSLFAKVIDHLAQIMQSTPHTDFDRIIVSCNRKDLFGNDVLYYLAFTKPGKLLSCQVIQKLIEQHWKSNYSSSNTALLHHSTSSQVIFHSKLRQSVSLGKLMLGNDEEQATSLAESNEHILGAVNFKAWKKGISLRFTIDTLLNFFLILYLSYMVVTYMDKDKKIDAEDPFVRFLLYFFPIRDIEQINVLDNSGFYVAFTYCFVIAGYYLIAVLSKGLLSAFYLMHTGHKGHQQISLTDNLLLISVVIYSLFYIYAQIRVPEFYESIEVWGELIGDETLINFNANLRNFNDSQTAIVSVRFWPFLAVAAIWLHFFAKLQFHRGIGTYVIMMRLAAYEFGKFLCFWFVSLAFFGCITLVWFGEFENYTSFGSALESLYLVSFGLRDMPEELEVRREGGFQILHATFVIVNLIGFLSFLTAMMTQTLVQSRSQLSSMQNGYFVERLPKERFSEKAGWITVLPMIFAPLFLVFTYPFFLLTSKIAKDDGAKKFNQVICAFVYFPIGLAQLVCFMLLNQFLIPMAYVVGLFQLIMQNPYQDRKNKRNKTLIVLAFAILGLPLLFLSQIPNAFFFLKSIYTPKNSIDALSIEKDRQSPVNTRNIQRMYQVVSKEVLEQAQDQRQQISFAHNPNQVVNRSKQLLERLRNSLGVGNCVKMMFFGSIPGFSKGSSKFMYQLQRENQTLKSQLDSYNLLKTQVLAHKEGPTDELRLGLLFQYMQEIKMKIVTQKALENYRQGKELSIIEFISIPSSQKTDQIAREILQTCPNTVLKVLQAEEQASQGLKESFFIKELQQVQANLLQQMRRQALQTQMLQGATMEQLRDNQSIISTSDVPNLAPVNNEHDRRKKRQQSQVNQYQLAIAQQEAVYGLARLMQQQNQKVTRAKDNESAYSKRSISVGEPQSARDPMSRGHNLSLTPDTANGTEMIPAEPTEFKAAFLRKQTMTAKQ